MRTWPAILVVPVIVLGAIAGLYALVPWLCARNAAPALHILTFALLALCILLTLPAWRAWRHGEPPAREDALAARTHLTAIVGTWTGSFFSLVLAVVWLTQWLLPVCAH